MKPILLLIGILISTLIFSQASHFINKKGMRFSSLPTSYRAIDTTVIKDDSDTRSHLFIGNSANSYILDTVKVHSNYNRFYTYHTKVEITHTNSLNGVLVIDTNQVFADSIYANGATTGISKDYLLRRYDEIVFRFFGANNNDTVAFDLTIEHETNQILIETNLPSVDTIFVDSVGTVFSSLPMGYMPYDTITSKIDSVLVNGTCTTSNSINFCNQLFNFNLPHQKFYAEMQLAVPPVYLGATCSIDTNGVNYRSSIYDSGSSSSGLSYFYSDTLLIDSNFTIDIGMVGGKNSAIRMFFEAFSTQTRVYILNTVGLGEIKEKTASVILHPIPSRDKILFKGEEVKNEIYNIFSVTGKLVLEGRVRNGEISIQSLSKGVFIAIISELGVRQKIVKN